MDICREIADLLAFRLCCFILCRLDFLCSFSIWCLGKEVVVVVVVVVVVFYGPSTHFRSFRARSVNLATLFLGKPPRHFTST